MPAGDRTGPRGLGAMTGRALGYCTGNTVPGFNMPGRGGFGFGRGMGNGFRGGRGPRWSAPTYEYPVSAVGAPYATPPALNAETEALRRQAEYLQETLDGVQKRLAQLEADNNKD